MRPSAVSGVERLLAAGRLDRGLQRADLLLELGHPRGGGGVGGGLGGSEGGLRGGGLGRSGPGLGLVGAALDLADAPAHVLGVDQAGGLGAGVGEPLLQLVEALLRDAGVLGEPLHLGVALLDLRLQRLQHHAQVALDAAQGLDLVRVVALAGDAGHALHLVRAQALALDDLELAGQLLLALAQLRLELAHPGDGLGVQRAEVEAGLVGGEGALAGGQELLALRHHLLGGLDELLRLLADALLDLLLGGRGVARVDRPAQAARGCAVLRQLLQARLDLSLAHYEAYRHGVTVS